MDASNSPLIFSSEKNYNSWQKVMLDFTEDPDLFMREPNLNHDTCVKQLFQQLLNKDLPEKGKVRLLLTIQDQIDLFIDDRKNAKKLLELLQNYYKQLTTKSKKSTKNYLLESQVLVTWTTVTILTGDNFEIFPELKLSFVALFDELTQLILNINNVDNCIIRSVACDCLVELELALPRLLSTMLETLKDVYVQEVTFVHYKYALLLSIAAKHEYTLIKDPFSVSQKIIADVISSQNSAQTLLRSPSISNIHEKQLLSLLMEHLSFLNNHLGSLVVRNVADIISFTKSTAPSILKSFVLQHKKTFDINLLHLICQLEMTFRDELFTENIEQQLLIHIFHLAHVPLLPSAQRLLYLDWLQHYAQRQAGNESKMKLDYGFALKFCPTIFDGWETSMKKFVITSTLLVQNENPDVDGITLWEFITCSYDVANNAMCRRAAVSIFRFLLIFLKNFGKHFRAEVIKFVTDFFQDHSLFVHNIVNFMNIVAKECLDGDFLESIWQSLVQLIVQAIEALNFDTLPHYFIILNEVAKNSSFECSVQVVNFLHALMETDVCESGSWMLGNQIVRICHSLLHYRDCNSIFTDLGDILHDLFTKYNDVDVRDNARFMYMILMSLSKQRIQNMFNYEICSTYQPHGNTTATLDSEAGSFGLTDRIVALKESPIELIKLDEKIVDKLEEDIERSIEFPKYILKLYRLHIAKDECRKHILISCRLQYRKENSEDFQKLFCIDIQFEHSDFVKHIKSITVPVLDQFQHENIVIEMSPTECKPIALNASATFNTPNCATFVCNLFPISLKFEDFFLPLPIPLQYLSCNHEWRFRAFDELWSSFSKSAEQGSTETDCQESVHLIQMEKNYFLSMLQQKFFYFLINNDTTNENTSQRVGIFLPPSNHMLLKFEIFEEKTITRIVVDHWKILPYLNEFLLSLERVEESVPSDCFILTPSGTEE
uniref:Uncharacterized protein n=1 Tax=Strigamia maritima TaxID=126957 RepID=T1IIT3_STRMM